jgi:exodeoxyribonuclease V alpha subunit
MTGQLSHIDNALLDFLNKRYDVDINSSLYNAAQKLLERLWQGSICISRDDLVREINDFSINCLTKSNAIGISNEDVPLIFDGENLYIQKYYVYQNRILDKIERLHKNGKLHIITGGPGTGKTTSLADILNYKQDKKILLAAPTGKAALRMKESLAKKGIELEAKTLHRLLGTIHLSVNFRHTKENPLEADLIAIDECSMVDLPMMARLLDAVPEYCDLYLLGDKNQLASVEAGSVFADICGKYKDDVNTYRELTTNWRARDAEGIDNLSRQILNKTVEKLDNDNVSYRGNLSINELFTEYKKLFLANNEKEALEFFFLFQVLCAIKNGRSGTENINKVLIIKAKKNNAAFTPIIITENSYQQGLFNGDVGVKNKNMAYFSDGENIRSFPLLTLPAYDDAFAITIHKSQGSEYSRIVVVYPDMKQNETEQTIFTRELLYTAVTRAKKECVIYGSLDIILGSCEKEINRASGIK